MAQFTIYTALLLTASGVVADNCNAKCTDSWDCGSEMGPCDTCHLGTCRPPPAPSMTTNTSHHPTPSAKRNTTTVDMPYKPDMKGANCYAQYCSDDIDCQGLHGQGCGTCSPRIPPIEYGICVPPASSVTDVDLSSTHTNSANCQPANADCSPNAGPGIQGDCCPGLACDPSGWGGFVCG